VSNDQEDSGSVDQHNGNSPTETGSSLAQFSVRAALLSMTAVALVFSGAFTMFVTALLGAVGLAFLWAGFRTTGELRFLALLTGTSMLALGAALDYLYQLSSQNGL